jgi:two-component system sensor histidine kinase KdpD
VSGRGKSDVEDRARFLALAQHKLKTPLAVIAGWSGTLQHWELLQPDERTGGLDAIARASEELRAQIDDILDEGRARLLTRSLELAPVPLLEFVDEELAVPSHDDDPHPMHVVIDPAHVVRADEEALRVALAHLLRNARAYSPDGGAIELASESRDGEIAIRVTDHGVGLGHEPEILFEPFRRGDGAAQITRGTGLGLHVVRLLVEAMGGRVTARDAGDGAVVEVVLPAA